jgi:hypothetical protein
VLFGGKATNKQFGGDVLWIYSLEIQEWFLVKPSTDQNSTSWPSNFNSRDLMSATPILNKGIILYTGGGPSDGKSILVLNIEAIINQISNMKT